MGEEEDRAVSGVNMMYKAGSGPIISWWEDIKAGWQDSCRRRGTFGAFREGMAADSDQSEELLNTRKP